MIKICNLKKEYCNDGVVTKILRGLYFDIKKGEFVAIMGPSGSGKSTLMYILGLLARPSSGLYELDGENIQNFSDNKLAELRNKKIGFVFQTFNLLPKTTVLENVKLPLIYFGKVDQKMQNKKAQKVIEAVNLSHRLNYLSSQLSGGEKQRVAIARALINNPLIIFADEPTGNLDSKSSIQIMNIFKKLNNEEGRTIILVTHEKDIAEYAERVIKMKDGQII
ncbi:ABC transporter ATP-binding protein [Candidatus Kuenenbacteria bacterium]|nr:ABC transporter ATP-binding protein [Candidatus Kuenenbacteria bacterium]